MGVKFLSDEWFAKVEELTQEVGDLEVPDALASMTVNLTVETSEGEKKCQMKAGQFKLGHAEDAAATVILPEELAKALFVEGNMQAGMQAFMSGQMRVEGDVSRLMVLQTAEPSEAMKELAEMIEEITD